MSSEAAAFVYSLLTAVCIFGVWMLGFRRYRTDGLRIRLERIREQVAELPVAEIPAGLERDLGRAVRNAGEFTLTRLLWVAYSGREKQAVGEPHPMQHALAEALIQHAAWPVPFWTPEKTKAGQLALAGSMLDSLECD